MKKLKDLFCFIGTVFLLYWMIVFIVPATCMFIKIVIIKPFISFFYTGATAIQHNKVNFVYSIVASAFITYKLCKVKA